MPKQYGLIIKSKQKPKTLQKSKLSFFDDDEDELDAKKTIETEIKESAAKKKFRKQTQLDIQRALEQDATAFEYDSIYDEMKGEKVEKEQTKKDKEALKPKYMHSLLKTAEKRNQLMERRMERKVQKERDAENGEFDDKEKFVTNAYKEKMKEIRKQEEEERKQDYMEEVMDVTKQKDMSGFYKHFLNRQTRTGNLRVRKEESSESEPEEEEEQQPEAEPEMPYIPIEPKDEYIEPKTEPVEVKEENPDADSDFLSDSDEDSENVKPKIEPGSVKTDPDLEMQEKNETLEEFKARLKQKKERRLDIYRTKHTSDTLEPFRQRYLERKEQRRLAGLYI